MANKVGSYSWFREHGHSIGQALKRSMEYGLGGLFPLPRQDPREKHIDDSLDNIDKKLTYISRDDYDPENHDPRVHSPEAIIQGSYGWLKKQPVEYWNKRTSKEFERLEEKIDELQQEGKLPGF